MKHRRGLWFGLLLLLILLTGLPAASAAPAPYLTLGGGGAPYNVNQSVIGGGGGMASAHFVVNGTLGQSLTSPPAMTAAHFTVNSGFWYAGDLKVTLPLILKQ